MFSANFNKHFKYIMLGSDLELELEFELAQLRVKFFPILTESCLENLLKCTHDLTAKRQTEN